MSIIPCLDKCSLCGNSGYYMITVDGKPIYLCLNCENKWQDFYRKHGGIAWMSKEQYYNDLVKLFKKFLDETRTKVKFIFT